LAPARLSAPIHDIDFAPAGRKSCTQPPPTFSFRASTDLNVRGDIESALREVAIVLFAPGRASSRVVTGNHVVIRPAIQMFQVPVPRRPSGTERRR